MERLSEWDHDQFKKVAVKVANMEIAYKAVSFYLQHQVSHTAASSADLQPTLLPDLLAALSARLDHGRVVKILQNEDHLPLAKPYLVGTQKLNIAVVNEAYNDLLIEEEDHVTLRSSLETFDQYDAIKLAKRLEKHELLEFRRIAALLYRVSEIRLNSLTSVEQPVRRLAGLVQGRSAMAGCSRDCRREQADRRGGGARRVLCLHWKQGCLYCHSLRLLRARPTGLCGGDGKSPVWFIANVSHGDSVSATTPSLTTCSSSETSRQE